MAVAVIPLFFNIYSGRPFEANKVSVLRILASLMAAAWLIIIFEEGKPRWQPLAAYRRWQERGDLAVLVAGTVIAYIAVAAASTLFSVAPRISFSGSYGRLEGLLTTLAYVLIFASVACRLVHPHQLRRLLDVTVLASIPVCLYGLLQHFRLDPLGWQSLFSQQEDRIFSTLGNPIFAGAYLIMVLPVTVAHAVGETVRLRETWSQILRLAICWTAVAMQLLVLWYTGSRGPWLGGLVGLAVGLLALAPHCNRNWSRAIVVLSSAGGAFLVTLNFPQGPLETLRRSSMFSRISHLSEASATDPSTAGRVLIWQGVMALWRPHEAIVDAGGASDAWNGIRPWIGYGPETLGLVSHSFMPPDLHRVLQFATPIKNDGSGGASSYSTLAVDSAHNAMLDSLASGGILGVLVHLALYTVLFYLGFRSLGLITTGSECRLYLLFYVGAGVVGAVFSSAWLGPEYFAIGVPAGLMLGLAGYLIWISLRGSVGRLSKSERLRGILLIGVLAALLGHFVETHFGVSVVTSRLYFWLSAGLLLVLSRPSLPALRMEEPETARPLAAKRGRISDRLSSWTSATIQPLLATALLITLAYDFSYRSASEAGPSSGLHTTSEQQNQAVAAVLLLMALTWLASWLLLDRVRVRRTRHASADPSGGIVAIVLNCGLTAGLLSIFWWVHNVRLSAIASLDITEPEELTQLAESLTALPTHYIAWFLPLALGLAWALPHGWPRRASRRREISAGLAVLIFGVAFLGGVLPNLKSIHADVLHHNATIISTAGQHTAAVRLYRRAISLAPREDRYYLSLGHALLNAATFTPVDGEERKRLLEVAEQALGKAQALSPLEPNHAAGLAKLSSRWAELAADTSEARRRAERAGLHYAESLRLSPNEVLFWNAWARLKLRFFDDASEAEDKLLRALRINPQFELTYVGLGDLHTRLARTRTEGRVANLEAAAGYYEKATAIGNSLGPLLGLVWIYRTLDDHERAIPVLHRALAAPGAAMASSAIHDQLAELYHQTGETEKAQFHATPGRIFADGFESGDTSAWSEP